MTVSQVTEAFLSPAKRESDPEMMGKTGLRRGQVGVCEALPADKKRVSCWNLGHSRRAQMLELSLQLLYWGGGKNSGSWGGVSRGWT